MQVNRVWFNLLGRGLVDPVDDFRASNPPSHPELLDALAADFTRSGFDLRHLIRTIMASRTYQLAAEPNDTNAGDDTNFSHAIVRRLSAEQLLDSMSAALAAPLHFEEFPEATRLTRSPRSANITSRSRAISTASPCDFGRAAAAHRQRPRTHQMRRPSRKPSSS